MLGGSWTLGRPQRTTPKCAVAQVAAGQEFIWSWGDGVELLAGWKASISLQKLDGWMGAHKSKQCRGRMSIGLVLTNPLAGQPSGPLWCFKNDHSPQFSRMLFWAARGAHSSGHYILIRRHKKCSDIFPAVKCRTLKLTHIFSSHYLPMF